MRLLTVPGLGPRDRGRRACGAKCQVLPRRLSSSLLEPPLRVVVSFLEVLHEFPHLLHGDLLDAFLLARFEPTGETGGSPLSRPCRVWRGAAGGLGRPAPAEHRLDKRRPVTPKRDECRTRKTPPPSRMLTCRYYIPSPGTQGKGRALASATPGGAGAGTSNHWDPCPSRGSRRRERTLRAESSRAASSRSGRSSRRGRRAWVPD